MTDCFHLRPRGDSLVSLQRHIPTGMAWLAARIPGKNLYRLVDGIAEGFEDLRRALCKLARELNPYSTDELLPEWERALSLPDKCLPKVTTKQERRDRLIFRLSRRRWTTAQDWKDLAALFGLEIVVTPGWLVQKPALYPASFPKRYDLFPKLGRFRVYINVKGFNQGGYDYGKDGRGPGYPIPYGLDPGDFDAFKCLIERVRPVNSIVIWNFPLDKYGFCIEDMFSDDFSEDFC